jgi:hypothetical protein
MEQANRGLASELAAKLPAVAIDVGDDLVAPDSPKAAEDPPDQ